MEKSKELREKLDKFAKEQALSYLRDSELTYLEKLRGKAQKTRNRVSAKIARLKVSSSGAVEAQEDLSIYLNDYVDDLMSKGLSEEEAYQQATAELSYTGASKDADDLQEHFRESYGNYPAADYETAGYFHAGFSLLGMSVGGLLAFLGSGGIAEFLLQGWIYTLIGIVTGLLSGEGLALIASGILLAGKHRR